MMLIVINFDLQNTLAPDI